MITIAALPWERLDERSTLGFRIAAGIARGIVEGVYEPGAWLTEADLASAGGASRTPAREAMLLLEAWSLVRLLPKKGAIVTAVSRDERQDLLDLRALLETDAVRMLARKRIGLSPLGATLETIIEKQRDALRASDLVAFAAGDYAFHARIVQSSGNAVIAELLDRLGPRFARLTHYAVTSNPPRVATLLDEHVELARLATTGDASGFGDMVRAHIEAGHFAVEGAS